ncbi:peptidyl-prolyl cis-trans isomerase [Polynucleobacter asymbioticus]|nr:peptidyl-prolyl cis-trans isomerase [Polynucleobacter asymbioticus]
MTSNISSAQSAGSVLVTVNGSKITTNQLNDWVASAVADGNPDTPQLRQNILNDLVMREAINQDVKKTGLLNKGNNAFKVKLAEQNAIVELWFAQYLKAHPITEADVQAEYDKQVALSKDPKNSKEYQVSQIVVATEAEALALMKQIKDPSSFAILAKEKSLDKSTSERGGLVGWALPSQLAAPMNEIVPTLTKGKIAPKPIQTNVGWYIIQLDDVKPVVIPPFDQVKENIARAMIQQKRQEAVSQLMGAAKIVKTN